MEFFIYVVLKSGSTINQSLAHCEKYKADLLIEPFKYLI